MLHAAANIGLDCAEGKGAVPIATASGNAVVSAHPQFPPPYIAEEAQADLSDVGPLIREVENILEQTDTDQAALTGRYIEAGQRLWEINRAHREAKRRAAAKKRSQRDKRQGQTIKADRQETFNKLLARSFPHRCRSTLREYMTLAREFDAANRKRKVQLTGLFPLGWGAVLGEIRRLKRSKRSRHKGGQPVIGDTKGNDLQIVLGDCMVKLGELPGESVDCVITSVPYFQRHVFPGAKTVFGGDPHCAHDWEMQPSITKRSMNDRHTVEGGTCRKCEAELVMLGWEETVADYVRHLVEVFREIRRVLKPTGVLWLNVDDLFSDKELQLVPQRLAIALDGDGWIVREDLIWHVTNRAPESTSDRFYRNHEYLFMLVKQQNYDFDAEDVREPAASNAKIGTKQRFTRPFAHQGNAGTRHRPSSGIVVDGLRNPRSVWSIPNEPFGPHHSCAFPKSLVERMVLSSCPEGGVCLDPFAGTGTVGLVALAHGRKAILIEANPEYCGIAKHRIETELEPYKAELAERRRREREAALLTPRSEIDVSGV